jgi:hypothetical protein
VAPGHPPVGQLAVSAWSSGQQVETVGPAWGTHEVGRLAALGPADVGPPAIARPSLEPRCEQTPCGRTLWIHDEAHPRGKRRPVRDASMHRLRTHRRPRLRTGHRRAVPRPSRCPLSPGARPSQRSTSGRQRRRGRAGGTGAAGCDLRYPAGTRRCQGTDLGSKADGMPAPYPPMSDGPKPITTASDGPLAAQALRVLAIEDAPGPKDPW